MHRATRHNGAPALRHQSDTYALSDLTSGVFWRSLYETRDEVQFVIPGYGYPGMRMSFEELTGLAGEHADSMADAVDADVSRLQRASRVALETKAFVAKASLADLMARTDLVMPIASGVERSLDELVAELVSPLARDLLAKGYIDENFTLYCSDYHAIAISVSAMNFILHCVQADRADHHFRFDEGASIDAVEKEMGKRFLDGESVFNLEVFDHYLPTHPDRLDQALAKLVARSGTDSSFVDAYLTDGTAKDMLVSRLTPRWSGVFVHLVEKSPLDLRATVALVDSACGNAAADIEYEASDRTTQFVEEHFANMQTFVGITDASRAANVVMLLRRLGAQISDISQLGQAQREAVVEAGLYPITRANLSAALGKGMSLALDAVMAADENVYRHILANLHDYLVALEEGEVTVDRPDAFITVLGDVVGASISATLPVVEGASGPCQVGDLEELDETAWPAVVAAGRFAPSVWNVSQFVEKFGVTEELVANLGRLELTDVHEVEDESRSDLAYKLADAEDLDAAARVRLIEQLDLPSELDPHRLTDTGLSLLPSLLTAGLVPDAPETYSPVSARPFAFREEYFVASKDLATYVCDLPLTGDDLTQMMRSRRVAPAVKRAIADDVDFVGERLTRLGAIAICEWANKGNEVSVELLTALAGAQAPAEHILGLLTPHLPRIELAALDRILLALGDEYEPLTRVGHHRPRLKERSGTEELLAELTQRGRVSSFGPTQWVGGIRVNMRH